jgi:hypothetical protein
MKSRSSTGVGMKIDLDYDVPSMRITDPGVDSDNKSQPSASDIMSKIKITSQIGSMKESTQESVDPITGEIEPEKNKVVADVQSAKLKSLLASLKK